MPLNAKAIVRDAAPIDTPGRHFDKLNATPNRAKRKQFLMDEMIREIKEIMSNVATGKARIEEINDQYQQLYTTLDAEFKQIGKQNPNPFADLWEFHHYWKENLPQYADRRNYIIKLYKTGREPEATIVDFWTLIHTSIADISKTRFNSGHFADSVEAALKEVNVRIKAIYRARTGQEDDGASLMKKAFSVNRPVIQLDDIGNETGRNIQQGYMELFSGAMIGIRNPGSSDFLMGSPMI